MNTPITDQFQSGLHKIGDKLNATLDAMRELEGKYNQQAEDIKHYKDLTERHIKESRFNKLLYYEEYKVKVGQQKGLNRQARKIKRLKARIAELES